MKKNLTTILFALVATMMPIGAWAQDAVITGVTITVDGVEYGVGDTAVVKPTTTSLIYTIKGENFANVSNMNYVRFSFSSADCLVSPLWAIDTDNNTAICDFNEMLNSFEENSIPFEVQYCNDGGATWINSGVCVVYDDGIKPEERAAITGLTITVDGVEYGVGDTAIITPTTTSLIYTVKGERFANATKRNYVQYQQNAIDDLKSGSWTIDSENNIASRNFNNYLHWYEDNLTPFEVQYSNDGGTTWLNSGVRVVYKPDADVLWGQHDYFYGSGTLQEAFMAVRNDGATYVQLQRNIVTDEGVYVSGNSVTLDLNGYTVNTSAPYLFDMYDSERVTHMTVIDNSPAQSGEIIANYENAAGAIFAVYGGHLTIESGSYVGNDNMGIIYNKSDGIVSINGGYLRTEKNCTIDNQGSLQISGGVFESSSANPLLFYSGSATVSGGTFIAPDGYKSFRYDEGVLDLAAYPTEVEEGTTPLNELNFTYWGESMALSELDIRLPEGYHVLQNNQVVDTLNKFGTFHFGTGITTDIEHSSTASTPDSQKILRNGQIIIIRDGIEYSIMGTPITH